MPYSLPTLYARREPTNDTVAIQYLDAKTLASCNDVIIYHDPDCSRFYANFPWFYNSKPDRRNRYVTLNCFRYRLVWL
ncbi:MAG TPA: hypothetical protein VJ875_02860 [Pyrinomonadaceae bacterium]|nr:hypothetical protein [Pyrinomonadaceae bacterium]